MQVHFRAESSRIILIVLDSVFYINIVMKYSAEYKIVNPHNSRLPPK
jgi:hypothetical protein